MSGRLEAANLIRAIRAVELERADDLINWAMTIVPDSPGVQRLHIKGLLCAGDIDGAEAAVARTLMQHPQNASLRLLRAQCMVERKRWTQARTELEELLIQRPHHRGTRKLAVQVALQLNEYEQALRLIDADPDTLDDNLKAMLVDALLGVGDLQRAEWTLDDMTCPPPTLIARVLQAQGRMLDAVEVYENALASGHGDEDHLLCALLAALEHVGDAQRLDLAMQRITPAHLRARSQMARIMLSQGRFTAAAMIAYALQRHSSQQSDALPTLVVAAAMRGRVRLARRALARLRNTPSGICVPDMAERWQRAMLGKLLRIQHSPRDAGCDPSSSVVQALLNDVHQGEWRSKKSRRIRDSAGVVAQMSERKNVLVSSPVDR